MYNGCVHRGTMQSKGFPEKGLYLSYMRSAIRNKDMILPKHAQRLQVQRTNNHGKLTKMEEKNRYHTTLQCDDKSSSSEVEGTVHFYCTRRKVYSRTVEFTQTSF